MSGTSAVPRPLIQYASGHTDYREREGTQRFLKLTGFHSEIGRDGRFDRACHSAGLQRIEIRHTAGREKSEIKPHWYFGNEISLFPIAGGPVAPTVSASLRNGNRRRSADAGIGVGWDDSGRSKLAVRGFLGALLPYVEPVQLAVSSRMTDYLMAALVRHLEVAEIADGLVNREKHPEPVGFFELALPLGAASSEAAFGRHATSNVTPLVCLHPAEIDCWYIRTIWRSAIVFAAAVERWGEVQAWAAEYGQGQVPPAGGKEEDWLG